MAGGAAVDPRAAPPLVLTDLRGDRQLSAFHDKVGGAIALVGAERHRPRPLGEGSIRLSAPSRSAWPEARVATAPTITPRGFSIKA